MTVMISVSKVVFLSCIAACATAAATIDNRPDMAIVANRARLQQAQQWAGEDETKRVRWSADVGEWQETMTWNSAGDSLTIVAPYKVLMVKTVRPGDKICLRDEKTCIESSVLLLMLSETVR